MFCHSKNKRVAGMNTPQHLVVDQIKGAQLDGVFRRMVPILHRGMNGNPALRQPAGMGQGMRQRAMLCSQQQHNQSAAQPFRAQRGMQKAGHVRE